MHQRKETNIRSWKITYNVIVVITDTAVFLICSAPCGVLGKQFMTRTNEQHGSCASTECSGTETKSVSCRTPCGKDRVFVLSMTIFISISIFGTVTSSAVSV